MKCSLPPARQDMFRSTETRTKCLLLNFQQIYNMKVMAKSVTIAVWLHTFIINFIPRSELSQFLGGSERFAGPMAPPSARCVLGSAWTPGCTERNCCSHKHPFSKHNQSYCIYFHSKTNSLFPSWTRNIYDAHIKTDIFLRKVCSDLLHIC